MNPEIAESTMVLRTIGKHLLEVPDCNHSIKEILKEALGPASPIPNAPVLDDAAPTIQKGNLNGKYIKDK